MVIFGTMACLQRKTRGPQKFSSWRKSPKVYMAITDIIVNLSLSRSPSLVEQLLESGSAMIPLTLTRRPGQIRTVWTSLDKALRRRDRVTCKSAAAPHHHIYCRINLANMWSKKYSYEKLAQAQKQRKFSNGKQELQDEPEDPEFITLSGTCKMTCSAASDMFLFVKADSLRPTLRHDKVRGIWWAEFWGPRLQRAVFKKEHRRVLGRLG